MIRYAIVASTIPPEQQLDARRTEVIYSENAVESVFKQINFRHEQGKPIDLLARFPKSKFEIETLKIGQLIGAELQHLESPECVQCVAKIEITDERIAQRFSSEEWRRSNVIFLQNGVGEESVERIAVVSDDGSLQDEISVLGHKFVIFFANIGEKRSSSNPFLKLLDK